MQDFYIPLADLRFDVDKIRNELETIVRPGYSGYALTVTKELAELDFYNFDQYNSITVADEYNIRRFPDGKLDTDLVFYPRALENSYIRQVEQAISSYLGLQTPRVRMSKIIGSSSLQEAEGLGLHTDPHTPFRVHLALETMPMNKWKFRQEGKEYNIHQPANGVPVLIEVANTEHSVIMAPRMTRMHIWFQYHTPVRKEILDSLLNKADNK